MTGDNSYIYALIVGILVLAGLTFMNLRKISKTDVDLAPLKKRTLMWTQISLVLFVVQLLFNREQTGLLVFFAILTLFTGAHWLGVRYYLKKRN